MSSLDRAAVELATAQHGIVSRRQLLRLGFSASRIDRWVALGRLHRAHAGVYALGHPLLSVRGRQLAAVLACGERAVLSHRSAAALWGLLQPAPGPIDVTVPGRSRKRGGISVRVTRSLDRTEIGVREGVPCTTPARTLVDLAAVAGERELLRALEQSVVLRILDRAALTTALEGSRGRRGAGALRRLLARLTEPPALRSELERRFLELVRGASLPVPVANGIVNGFEVDFHWPAHRLVVETDGRAFHGNAIAFDRDRRRDLALERAGWRVLRLGWRQVVEEPRSVGTALASLLA